MNLTRLSLVGGLILASIAMFSGCQERTISPTDETGITRNGLCVLSELLPQTGKQQYWIYETYAADSLGVLPPMPTYIDSAVFSGSTQLYGGKIAVPQIIYRSSDGGATYSVYDTIYTAYSDGKLYASHVLEDIRDICNCSSQKWTIIAGCSGGKVTTRDTLIEGAPYPSNINGKVIYSSILNKTTVTTEPEGKSTVIFNGKESESVRFRAAAYYEVKLVSADTSIRFVNGKYYLDVIRNNIIYFAKGVGIVFDRLEAPYTNGIDLKTKPYMRRLKKHVVL